MSVSLLKSSKVKFIGALKSTPNTYLIIELIYDLALLIIDWLSSYFCRPTSAKNSTRASCITLSILTISASLSVGNPFLSTP